MDKTIFPAWERACDPMKKTLFEAWERRIAKMAGRERRSHAFPPTLTTASSTGH